MSPHHLLSVLAEAATITSFVRSVAVAFSGTSRPRR
jgi:hypothetical protein